VTLSQARKALRVSVKALETVVAVQREIRLNNGDVEMIGSFASARRNLTMGIEKLCRIIPNAEILNRHLFVNVDASPLPRRVLANPKPATPPAWCEECSNPADGCLCVK
jgi:hypothetical protein